MNSKNQSNRYVFIFGSIIILFVLYILINFEIATAKDIFEIASYITILFGIPIGLTQYYQNNRKEQLDREYGTYDALDMKYLDYQRFCFDHPYLDISNIPDKNPQVLTPEQHKQESIAFEMLYSIFERSYLMYRDQGNDIIKKQWNGWKEYIEDYLTRPNFLIHLQDIIGRFEEDFDKFILKTIKDKKIPFQLPESKRYLE